MSARVRSALALRALDAALAIDAPPEVLADLGRLTQSLPALAAGTRADIAYRFSETAPGRYTLERSGQARATGLEREQLLPALLGDLSRMLAEDRTRALLHAAVLARAGRAILVAGDSGFGKTTLAAALVKCGLGYLSDELAPVDLCELTVQPFPIPLKLRESSLALLPPLAPEIEIAGEPFGVDGQRVFLGVPSPAVCVRERLPIEAIYFLAPRSSGGSRVERLSPAIAVAKIMESMLNIDLLNARAFELGASLASSARCGILFAGDPAADARLLSEGA